MKKSVLTVAIFITIAMASLSAFAQEPSARKGFVIGFDAGFGGLHFDSGRKRAAFLGSFKIGGGLNEKILLLAEDFGAIGFDGNLTSLFGLYLSPQFFVVKDFYVRPGVGFAYGEEDVAGGKTLQTDLGFATGLAVGYEWRLTKRLALSPELKFGYARIEGGNHYSYGAVVDLRWYF